MGVKEEGKGTGAGERSSEELDRIHVFLRPSKIQRRNKKYKLLPSYVLVKTEGFEYWFSRLPNLSCTLQIRQSDSIDKFRALNTLNPPPTFHSQNY